MDKRYNKIQRNKHKNQRVFIIGSGPSIKGMDLTPLKDEITICVNESYKALDFDPTYICIGDRKLYPLIKDTLAEKKSRIICSSGMDGSVGQEYNGDNLDAIITMNKEKTVRDDGFIWDMKEVYKAWNVIPELALPFVCWCGFDACYLIGCDCTNGGYFYDDSARPKGTQQVADETMICYDNISKMSLMTRVYNATVGGKLESFQRVNYNSIVVGAGDILVIGYYTADQNYKELAEQMKASVEAQGMECIIKERVSLAETNNPKPMNWVLNCSQCADFIHTMRLLHPTRPLLYLDADATMERRPSIFLDEEINYDFAAVFLNNKHSKDELVSNTLFFNTTDKADDLLHDWAKLQSIRNVEMYAGKYQIPYTEAWDQKVLQDVLTETKQITYKKLPYTYGKITVTPRGEELMESVNVDEIVITQHQASRINRTKV